MHSLTFHLKLVDFRSRRQGVALGERLKLPLGGQQEGEVTREATQLVTAEDDPVAEQPPPTGRYPRKPADGPSRDTARRSHCGLSLLSPGFLWALQGVLLLSQEVPVTFPSSLQIYSWRVLEIKLCSTFV